MNLKHLSNLTLHLDTKRNVSKERESTSAILWHLKETDLRKSYADWKCSSLFDYCVRELGYSEASAQRRIQAARLLEEMPEIVDKINNGELNLTTLGLVSGFCRENKIEGADEKRKILSLVEDLSKKETEKKLRELSGDKSPQKTKVALSEETIQELEELKNLMGKNLSQEELIKLAIKVAKEKIEKVKFKTLKNSKTPKRASLSPAIKPRVNLSAIKRAVFERDKVCTNCKSSYSLNFDHITPKSHGGAFTFENIRLLCSSCNQRARIRQKL